MADEGQPQEGFADRIKESPRTVSAIIIILIVAAAIYAFSGDQQQPGDSQQETAGQQATGELTPSDTASPAPADSSEADVMEGGEIVEQNEETPAVPAAERTGQGYVEVAQAGDGITHLARRATTRWLSENQAGFTVTDEHRIYIEDYIQNRLGNQGLEVGEQMTISFDLISEAVSSAQQLSDSQLQHLSQYTSALQ
ncbi:MAG: hypothetical protein COT71_02835 [Candidatus Andersenbacteria bacterium CG10_big_fil_rev_8_21_14_0_10_54_11]|uniref:Uncharacterized protein n=1 Tax=Candidatus Andersenbacteria bacterium CG10_big_fil_rev_8_21_14_0_10_54_11 TaxID=1974485 RepID=A0A2M6WZ20_9BACT|nr:MAG: hypothetical protein COT71_02835 [Candidatus Andersenbacteria bacterium CG10_big_fil_rev_8_21_14_0_10_54_11]